MIEIKPPVSAVKKINITIGVDSLCVYIFLRRVYGSGSDLSAITQPLGIFGRELR